MAAGSWTTDGAKMFQEGLQFPAIRLYEAGRPIESLIDLIAANVRTPERTFGDLYAGVAGLHSGERRVIEICRRYGLGTFKESVAAILHHGETLARQALAELPPGTYFAKDWIDDDGLTPDPIYVCVSVRITPDSFVADYTGSAPQVPRAHQLHPHPAAVGMPHHVKAITDTQRAGQRRVVPADLEVICPDGTIFTAQRPAPGVHLLGESARVVDLLWRCPFRCCPMTSAGGTSSQRVRHDHQRARPGGQDIHPGRTAGGRLRARRRRAMAPAGSCRWATARRMSCPRRCARAGSPLLVRRYGFNTTAAGAGKHRGGFGLVREYQVLSRRRFADDHLWPAQVSTLGRRGWRGRVA